jgi:hypothetical protein
MRFMEGLLKDRERAVAGKRFHRLDRCLVHLNGKNQAASARLPVDHYGASATDAMGAPDMSSRKTELTAKEISKQHPRFNMPLDFAAVHRHRD